LRVVFDTTTVVSALIFAQGRLAWMREHWQNGCTPLISRATTEELTRVLGYSKFRLSSEDRRELLADYLPFCEVVVVAERCPVRCRDVHDQPFLDLAHCGSADLVVSGDKDLLALDGKTIFRIESPELYRLRMVGDEI
jgi:putative PIN family toxin of toxin-antitoxin system